MLLQLNITNFALIENISISFEEGFHVLTGETGAGKSILIDAINFVLGGKFNKDLIRTGEERTFVEGIFAIENNKTIELLDQFGIEYEDLVIVSRETFQSGKSIAKVNGKSLLLSHIKAIAATLMDIHGQHENQNLLESSNHINYLDYFGGKMLQVILDDYKTSYERMQEIDSKIKDLVGKDGNKEKLIDFYKYQIEEIEKANLKENEVEELQNQYSVLSNAEKISKALGHAYGALCEGNENTFSIQDSLGSVIKDLRNMEKYLGNIKDMADNLEQSYYIIEEEIENIRTIKNGLYYDENELNNINSRMYQIEIYKRKYGATVKDIISYKDRIQKEYEDLLNSSEIIGKLKLEKEKLISVLKLKALKINEKRQDIAIELQEKVKSQLDYIGMEKSRFNISIEPVDNFYENGSDKVQFEISTNPGEPLKPLEKIVSGGELSRIMLALKTVFIDKDAIPSIIFDEIDTGISGRIAQSVAEKMYVISTKHQVFCVTHLSQIACMSDVHYLISKEVKESKTYTSIKKLNKEEKQYEIARMVGSSEVTKLTLQHAKELIKLAEEKKKNLVSGQ